MERPPLNRYIDLTAEDLARHPIWLNVHGVDESQPWYRDTDEVTYRPWDRPLPYDRGNPPSPSVVARTDFVFADGTVATGFLTPPVGSANDAVSYTQPEVFIPGGGVVSFYRSVRRLAVQSQQRLRQWLRRDDSAVFPVRFSIPAGIVAPTYAGELPGIYYLENGRERTL